VVRELRDCGGLDLNFWSILGRGSGWRALVVKTEVLPLHDHSPHIVHCQPGIETKLLQVYGTGAI